MNPVKISSWALAAAVALAAGCGGGAESSLQATPEVPAAMGQVSAQRTEEGNTRLEVQVEHLAPPEKVASDAKVYVVWATPLGGNAEPQNVGALTVDKNRKGSLKTLTPLDKFDLSVTPEPSANAMKPTNAPVMKAKVGQGK